MHRSDHSDPVGSRGCCGREIFRRAPCRTVGGTGPQPPSPALADDPRASFVANELHHRAGYGLLASSMATGRLRQDKLRLLETFSCQEAGLPAAPVHPGVFVPTGRPPLPAPRRTQALFSLRMGSQPEACPLSSALICGRTVQNGWMLMRCPYFHWHWC